MTQEPRPERAPPETPADPREPTEAHAPAALRTLQQAMRRARFDDAERIGVIADLRAARIGRLELLEEALQPLAAQIPEDVDLFDFGLMPGANPRLFLDMIGFVEMGRDARTYRLVQDTRHGRKLIAESDRLEKMVESVTDYVARRLLERDKALAADGEGLIGRPAGVSAKMSATARPEPASTITPRRRSRAARIAGATFGFVIDLLGSIAFFTIVFAILFWLFWLVWAHLKGNG